MWGYLRPKNPEQSPALGSSALPNCTCWCARQQVTCLFCQGSRAGAQHRPGCDNGHVDAHGATGISPQHGHKEGYSSAHLLGEAVFWQ